MEPLIQTTPVVSEFDLSSITTVMRLVSSLQAAGTKKNKPLIHVKQN